MSARRIETAIAILTFASLVIYVPGETWVSLPYGLWNPFYLVDLIAMILLFWGALHSWRARPRCAPALLCAAYGWAASNGWRSTAGRVYELVEGRELDYGIAELWVVGAASIIALICFALLLWLTWRQGRRST